RELPLRRAGNSRPGARFPHRVDPRRILDAVFHHEFHEEHEGIYARMFVAVIRRFTLRGDSTAHLIVFVQIRLKKLRDLRELRGKNCFIPHA
ncbi:MAG: hypothetical protein U9Q71_01890, partial [Pseudomonadota bacterium]|nr:hypothetical protein [Pseudomonadota bacterium]